ncbi:MAG: hypothetical protein ACE5I7_17010 [Candidatus Binatia bacterium]
MPDPEIHIVAERVTLRQGSRTLVAAPLPAVMQELVRSTQRGPSCGILPRDVRLWYERGDATAMVVEVPPHARSVRWLVEGSRAAFGRGARYTQYFIAFPYVELLLVFRRGALTGFQQLYYRRAPLGEDEELLLPNLYNVAQGYGQRCWVCLANMRDVSRLSWSNKVGAIVDHVFTAGWNRSSEVHEGNSYFSSTRGLDARVATLEAWQAATRCDQRFALEVPWKPAGTTATAELTAMLDEVVPRLAVRTATDLAGAVTRAGAGPRKARS